VLFYESLVYLGVGNVPLEAAGEVYTLYARFNVSALVELDA
jgi:hypothetical protein